MLFVDRLKVQEFYPKKCDYIYLKNDKNEKFLDLSSGNILGNNNKIAESAIIQTLHQNLLNHSCDIENETLIELQNTLCKLAGFFEKKDNGNIRIIGGAKLQNSAKESIDLAISIARNRYNILCDRKYNEIICIDGYSLLNDISLNNLNGFKIAKNNDLKTIETCITEHTSAILLETIEITNRLNEYNTIFWQKLRQLCDKHEILLILDETKCGCGKAGSFFAYEKYNIKPDIVCIANDFVNGFSCGACIFNNESLKFYKQSIYNINNNINCMYVNIASKMIETLSNKLLSNRINKIENSIKFIFRDLLEAHSNIIDFIKIKGLMCYLEINSDINIKNFIEIIMLNGLLVKHLEGNKLLLTFPAICEEKHIKEAKQIIEVSIGEIDIIERY